MEISPELERKLGMIKALGTHMELEIKPNGNIALSVGREDTVYNDIEVLEEYVDKKLHEIRNVV